jgi:hypothetical protein
MSILVGLLRLVALSQLGGQLVDLGPHRVARRGRSDGGELAFMVRDELEGVFIVVVDGVEDMDLFIYPEDLGGSGAVSHEQSGERSRSSRVMLPRRYRGTWAV